MANQLYNVFEDTLERITTSLRKQANDFYCSELAKKQKTLKTKPYQVQIDKLNAEAEKLTIEIDQLEQAQEALRIKRRIAQDQSSNVNAQMQALDKPMQFKNKAEAIKSEIFEIPGIPSYYSIRETEYATAIKCLETKYFQNLLNWIKVRGKYRDMRNLAISQKQKQNIVLELQNTIDWHGLGIDIPALFTITEIKVVDWSLQINNAIPALKNNLVE